MRLDIEAVFWMAIGVMIAGTWVLIAIGVFAMIKRKNRKAFPVEVEK